jgi:hypothetical protein
MPGLKAWGWFGGFLRSWLLSGVRLRLSLFLSWRLTLRLGGIFGLSRLFLA